MHATAKSNVRVSMRGGVGPPEHKYSLVLSPSPLRTKAPEGAPRIFVVARTLSTEVFESALEEVAVHDLCRTLTNVNSAAWPSLA